jgi:predicted RNase H-like nuclease (RuvC/YqgF family)
LKSILESNEKSFQEYRERISKYESTISMLETEINRFRGVEIRIKELNQVIESKENDIQEWRSRYSELTRQIESYRILETKIAESESRNQSLLKEIE